MVGLFSRFSCSKSGHRRSKSALEERDVMLPNPHAVGAADAAHVIEVAIEFKPIEHPIEPFDNDQPIQCPLPEPSILNDGTMWKEQASANVRLRADLPIMKEGCTLESEATATKPEPTHSNRLILPSLSAPERDLLNLLEECNASGI